MFSKILRRTHMYVALFLAPWILMYTLSTFVMNHRKWFRGEQPSPPRWEKISESVYDGEFPSGAGPEQMAGQILAGLNIDGAHQAALRGGALVIQRFGAVEPARITYTAANRKLVVEKQVWDGAAFLERMHRRRGYQHAYGLEDTWAFSVDVFIAAVLFWALSGLWMWWGLRVTRVTGAIFALGGLALFAFLVAVL